MAIKFHFTLNDIDAFNFSQVLSNSIKDLKTKAIEVRMDALKKESEDIDHEAYALAYEATAAYEQAVLDKILQSGMNMEESPHYEVK